MSEKSKNLRKNLSKKGVSQPKPEAEVVETIKPAPDKNYPDPLSMFDDVKDSKPEPDPLKMIDNNPVPKPNANTLQFLDLISTVTAEKKEAEKLVESNKEQPKPKVLQCHKVKAQEAPMKIINPHIAEPKTETVPPKDEGNPIRETRTNPGRLDKQPEMDEEGKNRLMERMKTAKTGVAKNFGKALLKRSSEAIKDKAKELEKNVNFNERPKNVLQDDDVQFIDDGVAGTESIITNSTTTTTTPQTVDFSVFAKPKVQEDGNDSQKEKRSLADMILKRPALAGKKKGAMPEFNPSEEP